MMNIKTPLTTLCVAVNSNGEIVNDNDSKGLGPAFELTNTKVRIDENGEMVDNYALHIDADFNKQGAFSILNCRKITAEILARRYCENNYIWPIKKSWLYRNNYDNIFQVVDVNNVEYNFHISRAYYADGIQKEIFGAYVSIKKENKITMIEITNLNDL